MTAGLGRLGGLGSRGRAFVGGAPARDHAAARGWLPGWAGALLAALFGAAMVLWTFGLAPVDPWRQGWIWTGLGVDPPQLWLGWTFFRQSPWTLPPGANPDYGLELSSAIYFADAIPLLALPLKALRGLVEVPQYIGPWLVLCGALQGLIGWRLVGLATRDPLARLCGAGLLALQPMLLHRMTGHTPLGGQWTLLAGLLLALGPGRGWWQGLAWAALLAVTTLVHSYLLAMLMPIWAADWLRRVLEPPRSPALAMEAVAAPGAVLAALWAGGFFLLRGGFNTGPGHEHGTYGTWSFDLLGFLDPGLWSSLLPDLPDAGHWEAGTNYLGLGGALLLAAGALALWRRPTPLPRRLWPLAAALLALLAFAVTHRPALAGHAWSLFEPSPRLLEALGTLRNSNRMAWPLAYALLLGAIALAARAWGGRRTGLLLLGLLVVQVVDLAPGLGRIRAGLAGAPVKVPQELSAPFWAEAAARYGRLRAVPGGNLGEGWERLAPYAALNRLPTDAIYMARVDTGATAALRAKVAGILASGAYEPGTFYVLRDAASLELARGSAVPGRDLIRQVDEFWVLAPGWCAGREAAACEAAAR
ncbi:DUF6311 domain-containing protein [Roseicella aquatilis]|uniref:Glycosyltransferase RgtA/B/C/D-like domain-containing protein n=1 Tax=Roseicella aquatilis TaxID=2527868 RepID=A0A4R4DGM9_9PROT|nr:DUF6311 domain-containing protein [Roseicella aquatilis]TCZ58727.1 hypothetical protein EXY23_16065 [Roseicella aquatilis]